ncbi:hypothetical protein TWF569_003020 [Orbilia oligospora]|nr:hypothetical protein TWF706_008253 [Orbilia oligospora]KAF3152722.1 hypothetical protein TWF569_003020 [Orbilia oligospora]
MKLQVMNPNGHDMAWHDRHSTVIPASGSSPLSPFLEIPNPRPSSTFKLRSLPSFHGAMNPKMTALSELACPVPCWSPSPPPSFAGPDYISFLLIYSSWVFAISQSFCLKGVPWFISYSRYTTSTLAAIFVCANVRHRWDRCSFAE